MTSQPVFRFRSSTTLCLFFLYLCLSTSSSPSHKPKPRTTRKSPHSVQMKKKNNTTISKTQKKLDQMETKNQTKPIKPKSNSTTSSSPQSKPKLPKPSNSTKPIKTTNSTKPPKLPTKPTKPTTTTTTTTTVTKPMKPKAHQPKPTTYDDEDDLLSEFRDLPSKFHETLLSDLEKISTTSKAYLTRANLEITNNFKPIVGNKYAPTIASLTSCVFLIMPLLLLSLAFHQIKTYLSLSKILLFIQAYLAIYFGILSITSFVTCLEPLKLFYATSPTSYFYTQVFQMGGYVLVLLMQVVNLIVVFSTVEIGLGSKALGLAQVFVGFSVGLHYYAAVFHRAVKREAPRTNWRIHAVYSVCFLVICAFARVDRRKKAYVQEGGEDGKKS
ncbi:hypothetical protein QJS10_CPB19g01432 [Acorus calamus]|uniref:Uncharacterized protein n=1 Tax=Acorus calamus TaxID=4465 RepID=A0AAV9CH52_ACOCL|nr:hypothetical protein QJS10_CPB19g01432 [Acorus calamus]